MTDILDAAPILRPRRPPLPVPDRLRSADVAVSAAALAELLGRPVLTAERVAVADLAHSADPRLAVAAHLTLLLADGVDISRQHADDVLATVRDVVAPGTPPAAAVRLLAAAI